MAVVTVTDVSGRVPVGRRCQCFCCRYRCVTDFALVMKLNLTCEKGEVDSWVSREGTNILSKSNLSPSHHTSYKSNFTAATAATKAPYSSFFSFSLFSSFPIPFFCSLYLFLSLSSSSYAHPLTSFLSPFDQRSSISAGVFKEREGSPSLFSSSPSSSPCLTSLRALVCSSILFSSCFNIPSSLLFLTISLSFSSKKFFTMHYFTQ